MRVVLRSWGGPVGEVVLDPDGCARATDQRTREFLDAVTIVEPGTLEVVGPEDGERYLRALPAALSGSYFAADLVEERRGGDAGPAP